MKLITTIVLAFFVFNSAGAVAVPALSNMQIFIIAGQSNAAGHAPRRYPTGHPRHASRECVWRGSQWSCPAREPLPSPNTSGHGPGLYFADAYLDMRPFNNVGLVMCAVGGSAISTWQPGGTRLRACYTKVAAALAKAPGSHVSGVLFVQGEAESSVESKANSWPAKFTAMVNDMRTKYEDPNLPVVYAPLGNPPGKHRKFWDHLRTLQQNIVIPNVFQVDTSDLTYTSDRLHYDAASAKLLGERMAAVMP